jgi:hypothetical protein
MIQDWLKRLTFRRIVWFAGILLVTMAFAQFFTIDVAFMFAGDAMIYFEVFALVGLIAVRGHLRVALDLARQRLAMLRQHIPPRLNRFRETTRRACRRLLPPKDDEGEPAFA